MDSDEYLKMLLFLFILFSVGLVIQLAIESNQHGYYQGISDFQNHKGQFSDVSK